MIHLSCSNCGWALFGRAVIRVDTGSVDMTCHKCHAVYRVSICIMREGEPQDVNAVRRKLGHTYDSDHNRLALPDVPRPAPVEE
jgi:uncharacterized Zn finger protein